MDIQYLLWLQELRNATGGVFDRIDKKNDRIGIKCTLDMI